MRKCNGTGVSPVASLTTHIRYPPNATGTSSLHDGFGKNFRTNYVRHHVDSSSIVHYTLRKGDPTVDRERRRAMRHTANDHRTRVTNLLIRRAFLDLLRQKPMQSITVEELCGQAGINRGTFYSHYTDIYDLLGQMEAGFQ